MKIMLVKAKSQNFKQKLRSDQKFSKNTFLPRSTFSLKFLKSDSYLSKKIVLLAPMKALLTLPVPIPDKEGKIT